MEKKYLNFGLVIFLVAANMRISIIMLSPILTKVAAALNLSSAVMGSLTSIPLLCFALLSIFVAPLGNILGSKRSLNLALGLIIVANLFRVYSPTLLILGTLLCGIGITFLNVLIPAAILEWKPKEALKLNGLYTASNSFFCALTGGVASPLAQMLGWKLTLQLSAIPAVLAMVLWNLYVTKNQPSQSEPVQKSSQLQNFVLVLKRPEIWLLALYMGLQSVAFYALTTWLPTVISAAGFSANQAGLLFAFFQIVGFPVSYIAASFLKSKQRYYGVTVALIFCFTLGSLLLVYLPNFVGVVLACIALGFGVACTFTISMSLISILSKERNETNLISGMVQTIGYLLASLGPTLFGYFKTNAGWNHSLWFLTITMLIWGLIGLILGRFINWQKH